MNKKSKEKAESVHGILARYFRPEWVLRNLGELETLDDIRRIRKKRRKRTGEGRDLGRDLDRTIEELFRAIEELKSSGLVSHATLDRARELAESWHPEFGKSNPLIVLLTGLVTAQNRKIEGLDKLRQFFSGPPAERKLSAKQRSERGRRYVPAVGEIEWEFGGVRPPGTSDMNDKTMNCFKPPEPPTCLDGIFAGHSVNMQGLVLLFGRERHLLAKIARVMTEKGRETLYDYRAVRDIMDALLSERKRKSSTRGRPQREPWLSDPPTSDWRPVNHFWRVRHYCRSLRQSVREPLRTRVLTGIEARINGLSERVPKRIKSAFLAVICPIRVKNRRDTRFGASSIEKPCERFG